MASAGLYEVCTSLQTDNHASTPPVHSVFYRPDALLPPNQRRQSAEGTATILGNNEIVVAVS